MKILIKENKVLDTIENKIIENTSNYDREHKNTNIIYNIYSNSSKAKMCCLYSCKKEQILPDMPFEAVVDKFKQAGVSFQIITFEDEQEPQQKNVSSIQQKNTKIHSKSIILLRKIAGIDVQYNNLIEEVKNELDFSNKKIENTAEMFSKDLNEEERNKIKEQNLKEEIKHIGRFVDADLSKMLNDEGQVAVEMFARAMKTLYEKNRFYYTMLNGMNVKFLNEQEAKKEGISTIAVSMTAIYINIEFVLKLKLSELVFILCHEALHIVLNHHARLLSRNAQIYNIAGDTVINLILSEELKTTPSKPGPYAEFAHGGIYYPKLDKNIETADSIYDKIVKQNPSLEKQIEDFFNNLDNNNPDNQNPFNNQSSQAIEGEIPPELMAGSSSSSQSSAEVKNTNKLYETVQRIFDTMNKIKNKLNDPQNASIRAKAESKLIALQDKINEIGKMVEIEKQSLQRKKIEQR